jgi:hypothetical protein
MACILQRVMILESHVEGVSTIEFIFISLPFFWSNPESPSVSELGPNYSKFIFMLM